MSDMVHNPSHYERGGMRCKDVLKAMMCGLDITPEQGYWLGCVLKYVWRWKDKDGVRDLRKARECLTLLIEDIEREHASEASRRG